MDLRSLNNHLTRCLPAEWRAIYSWTKQHLLNPQVGRTSKSLSLTAEFTANWITILTSCLVIAAMMMLKTMLPPKVSLAPFFVFGCVFPALVISRRWGTMAAMLCTIVLSVTPIFLNHGPFHLDLFLWNAAMRFLFFEFYVVIFDCVRRLTRDSSGADEYNQASPPASISA